MLLGLALIFQTLSCIFGLHRVLCMAVTVSKTETAVFPKPTGTETAFFGAR